MNSPNKLEQLLLDCLKKNPDLPGPAKISSLSTSDWTNFLELAKMQKVRALLHHRLEEKRLYSIVPDEVKATLKNAYRQNTMKNLRLYGELRRLSVALDHENMPLIVLKGMFLAQVVYDNIGLREMIDIDLLAHPENLSRIAEVLSNLGFESTHAISDRMVQQTSHHISPMFRTGIANVEVHWNLTSPEKNYSIVPTELWQRACHVRIAGCDLLSLCTEDILLHLCMHVAYQHHFAFGLRPSCDIAEFLDHYEDKIVWTDVLDRAKCWGWRRGVYLALRLANELLDAKVPAHVMKDLKPEDPVDGIVSIAREQIFIDARIASTIRMPFAQLIAKKSLYGRLKILWSRVFLPSHEMNLSYSLDRNSYTAYFYYPRRAIDMMRRHGHTICKVFKKDNSILELAERKCMIGQYLSEN